MPDSGKDEESAVRGTSVEIVAESESSSYASCSTCGGPYRTPTLHKDICTPVHFTPPGKDADGEVGAGVVAKKVNAASSSSSSPAAEMGKSLASCSKQHDQKPLTSKLACMSLEEPRKERPLVILEPGNERPVVDVVPAEGNVAARLAVASSFNPGPSAILKGKRKAEDTNDGPVSSAKTNRKASMSEAAKASKESWEDWDLKILGDLPGSSAGLGHCMQILSLGLDVTDPMGIQPMDVEPERRASPFVLPFAIALVPGFSICTMNGGVSPVTDELLYNDPECVGLEELDVLTRPNGEEPTSMDQDEL